MNGIGSGGRTSSDTGRSSVGVENFETMLDFRWKPPNLVEIGPNLPRSGQILKRSGRTGRDFAGFQRDLAENRPNLDETSPDLNEILVDLEEIRPDLDLTGKTTCEIHPTVEKK